jgi:hypothetical protein
MNKKKIVIAVLLASAMVLGSLGAQTTASAVNGMTLNGSTGLIVVPDARVGWENSDFGIDVGYGIVWSGGDQIDHMPRVALSLVRRFEISSLLQIGNDEIRNFIIGGKFQMFKDRGAALALGGDYEFAKNNFDGQENDSAKIYLAATYGGNFFNMPAITTATFGWQLLEVGDLSSQFVYGMGFSMGLFPSVFKDYVYWITDFSNFSYAVVGSRVNAGSRGAFNTGVRIHPVKGGKFNLVIDVTGTDLLDDGDRGMAATVSGGMAF